MNNIEFQFCLLIKGSNYSVIFAKIVDYQILKVKFEMHLTEQFKGKKPTNNLKNIKTFFFIAF